METKNEINDLFANSNEKQQEKIKEVGNILYGFNIENSDNYEIIATNNQMKQFVDITIKNNNNGLKDLKNGFNPVLVKRLINNKSCIWVLPISKKTIQFQYIV